VADKTEWVKAFEADVEAAGLLGHKMTAEVLDKQTARATCNTCGADIVYGYPPTIISSGVPRGSRSGAAEGRTVGGGSIGRIQTSALSTPCTEAEEESR
jgi:hypothetical protein